MQDFRKLKVWEKSHQMTLDLYRLTKMFPKDEMYALTSQIRRATSSIPANLCEGCGRSSNADFARFCQISFGSACELEYHLILAHDLTYLNTEEFKSCSLQLEEIKRMLASFLQKLRTED
jgi:four helix bundle protein